MQFAGRTRAIALGALSAFAYATSAAAWENDVHYGLTKWLALQAGFTEEQATWIANGDVGIDKSPITEPVHTTIVSACVGSDTTGSGQVHDHHFPSDRSVPNDPNLRDVRPGYVQQGGNVQSAPRIRDYNDQSRFREFGEYLHAFQDTWPHQGEPDVPPVCDPKPGCGHAFNRGGWACHLADLTYHWRDKDVVPMAKATYDALLAQTPGAARSWDDLKPKIEGFAIARSKWEKDAWFTQENFYDRSVLQEISLPDCIANAPCPGPYAFQKVIENWNQISKGARDWRPPSGFVPITFPVDVIKLVRDPSNCSALRPDAPRGSSCAHGNSAAHRRGC
jgi:hypothetical protein